MDLETYLKSQESQFLDVFEKIVTLESPTCDKQLNDLLATHLENLFQEIGKVKRIPQQHVGDNLKIEFGEGEEQILILCHMDTVWDKGEVSKRPFHIDGNQIKGPGVYDMKFGIVQAFYAFKAIKECAVSLSNRIVLYINSDEETGSKHSETLIAAEAKKSKCVLVLEPSEESGYAKTERKGMVNYRLTCHGKSAHAGAFHQDGISAVREIAHQILAIESLTNYQEGITANVGIVKGGSRPNVIPDCAEVTVDFRYKKIEQARSVHQFMNNLKSHISGTSFNLEILIEKAPFEKNEQNQRLYRYVQKAAERLNHPMGEISAGGLSDGNITSVLGIPTIDGMGAIGSHSHSLDEYVQRDTIIERTLLLITVLKELNHF